MRNSQSKIWILFGIVLMGLQLIFPEEGLALPAYKRLFQKKYNYEMSCYLCHSQGGGSALGRYGKDFKRRGMTFMSFGKLEDMDSDKDGSKNLAEILARSNPGDKVSTPENPGDWLERIEESFIPREQLVQIYPDASSFSIIEGSLNDKQIQGIETSLGRKLVDAETVPTFYFAFAGSKKDARRIGLAMFVTPVGKDGLMSVGVGIGLNGTVQNLIIYKSKEDQNIFQGQFLSQFEGKAMKDAFKVGQDVSPVPGEEKLSATFSESVKLSLLTMYQVFAKRR